VVDLCQKADLGGRHGIIAGQKHLEVPPSTWGRREGGGARGQEGERARGREGERARGREGGRARGREGEREGGGEGEAYHVNKEQVSIGATDDGHRSSGRRGGWGGAGKELVMRFGPRALRGGGGGNGTRRGAGEQIPETPGHGRSDGIFVNTSRRALRGLGCPDQRPKVCVWSPQKAEPNSPSKPASKQAHTGPRARGHGARPRSQWRTARYLLQRHSRSGRTEQPASPHKPPAHPRPSEREFAEASADWTSSITRTAAPAATCSGLVPGDTPTVPRASRGEGAPLTLVCGAAAARDFHSEVAAVVGVGLAQNAFDRVCLEALGLLWRGTGGGGGSLGGGGGCGR
jgi:hypothetical protein